jgi:hypothetical protein
MSVRQIIVSHGSVPQALTQETPATGLESPNRVADFAAIFHILHQEKSNASGATGTGPATAEMASRFSHALSSLEESVQRPGAMTALEDEAASLLSPRRSGRAPTRSSKARWRFCYRLVCR